MPRDQGRSRRCDDIPVILVTALNDAKDIIRGIECGADNFIRKPYAEDYLLSRISQMLANQAPAPRRERGSRASRCTWASRSTSSTPAASRSSTC